ncbi:hypothetical protein E4T56_gene18832 [Termitomyces sp. T112]|nr:hypothetical protein E4T56_gene18832 [Termitomyces sp. T112]
MLGDLLLAPWPLQRTGWTTPGAIPDLEQEARTISPADCAGTSPNIGPKGPATAANNSDGAYSSTLATTKSSKEEVKVCADGGGMLLENMQKMTLEKFGNPRTLTPPPAPSLQCSAKLPNPRPPSVPTSGNSDTSSADPDSSLINSDAFSAAVDASPEFPWTPEAFPDPGTIHFPTDPIRMSPRPVPRLHLTTVDSVQSHQAAAISSALWSHPVVGI